MARSSRYLKFEGQFESSVLGTFRIIRGFANLKDLAKISVPYEEEIKDTGEIPGKISLHIKEILRRAAIGP